MPSTPSNLATFRAKDGYDRWSRWTDGPLFALAILFLALLVVPRLWEVTPTVRTALTVTNYSIWAAFAVDYFARLYLAERRWRYVRTHVLDLLIVALPMLRPLRFFRVLRFVSVAAIAHKRASASLHGRMLTYVAVTTVVSLVLAGALIRDVEAPAEGSNIHTLSDGLWWAVTTVTTVGYGDRYPVTDIGRIIAFALMLIGIALLGVITASIATWFVDRLKGVTEEIGSSEERTDRRFDEVMSELRALRAEVASLSRESA